MKLKYSKLCLAIVVLSLSYSLTSQNNNDSIKSEIVFSWYKKDSVLTELKIENTPRIVPVREQRFIFEIRDSIIKSYETFYRENGVLDTNDTIYINLNNDKFYNSLLFSPQNISLGGHLYEQDQPVSFDIEEFKNERKKIKGFDCYKVIVKTKFTYDKTINTIFTYKLFVSEKIKLKYHPVLHFKEFTKDFYPLDIKRKGEFIFNQDSLTKYQKLLKRTWEEQIGKEIHYKLVKITL